MFVENYLVPTIFLSPLYCLKPHLGTCFSLIHASRAPQALVVPPLIGYAKSSSPNNPANVEKKEI